MIDQFIQIIESLGINVLDCAAIIYIVEHCIFKPVMWFFHRHKED